MVDMKGLGRLNESREVTRDQQGVGGSVSPVRMGADVSLQQQESHGGT